MYGHGYTDSSRGNHTTVTGGKKSIDSQVYININLRNPRAKHTGKRRSFL